MEPGLRGPEGDAQRLRHVGQRHPEEVMEDDDRSPLGFERPERAVDLVTVDDAAAEIGDGWRKHWMELHLDRPSTSTSEEIEAGVDEQSMDPGVESLDVAQRGQVTPGPDEGLLDRVSRELAIPEDQAGGRVQPRDGLAGELGEGVMIASLRPFDESLLVHGALSVRRLHGGRVR